MNYGITEEQKDKIIEKWGNDFYLKVLQEIEIYSEKWKLSDFVFVEYYSFNAIFLCKSELHGDCVLKMYSEDFEYDFLREYNGRRFVKAFEYDDIILLERVIPGTMLKNEPLKKRLTVFSELFNGLHIEPENPEIFPSYTDWVYNRVEYMKTREDCEELYAYMLKAKGIYTEMLTVYNKKALLHGDLHCDNILLNSDEQYKIIDPLSYIGDPVFEFGRHISHEYRNGKLENKFETITKIVEHYEKSLNIPNKILRQCFYIDIVAGRCCRVEGGGTPDLNDVKFAESIINGK